MHEGGLHQFRLSERTVIVIKRIVKPARSCSADVLVIRDPFEEEDASRARCSRSNQVIHFNQRPPQYINTGNPLHFGGLLDLPRHLRVPYPESAYRACAAANKNLANSRAGQPVPGFMPLHPGAPGPRPGPMFAPNAMQMENSRAFANQQQQQQPQQQQQHPGGCTPPQMMPAPAGYGNSCYPQPSGPQMMVPPGIFQSKANKASAAAVSSLSNDEQQQQQLLMARRKQQPLMTAGQTHPGLPPGMLPAQDFYMPQGMCAAGTMPPPSAMQPRQQHPFAPMVNNVAAMNAGTMAQFDAFDGTL
ncbi:unnamed protein product [Gongylonema pulchrum]|uniref:Mastermind-like protein 2 n=1 Tax=Gongylonema pulchrum TaxID=637853 RepID=A0A183EE30_9BILA|nr:unnamed protein product [Gongylonema pulchrum]